MSYLAFDTFFGLLGLLLIGAVYVRSSYASVLGALSLPCMTMATAFIYFYLIPSTIMATGDTGYLGLMMGDMRWAHFAVFLYSAGAALAFVAGRAILTTDPARPLPGDRPLNLMILFGLWGVGLAGVVLQIALGRFDPLGSADVILTGGDDLRFINLTFSMLVPVAIVTLIRFNFNPFSVLALLLVAFILLQVGFRYRIVILLAGAATAYALTRGLKVGILGGILGCTGGLFLVNIIGAIRRYGDGVNLSNLDGVDLSTFGTKFSGEAGIAYVLGYVTENRLPPPAWVEPWIVGIAGLVPSAIWPGKPRPDYLAHIVSGAGVEQAEKYGVAASQHVEFLLQAGWWGLLPLTFLYYFVICKILARAARTGRETRIAAFSIAPAFFGFYMQSRGYFFQILTDFLFMIGPLFLMVLLQGATKAAATASAGGFKLVNQHPGAVRRAGAKVASGGPGRRR
ncbi:MAG: hypothetical protein K2Y29_20735 [Beijerinckiaceae bacterium]|nr:hypothetical protein [Beijerinckiaceae bacterium]